MDIIVGGKTVQGVQDFVDLGSQISSTSGSRTEQQKRIGIPQASFNAFTMSGTSVTFTVDQAGSVFHRSPAIPTIRLRNLDDRTYPAYRILT